jgi:hypothetical protein
MAGGGVTCVVQQYESTPFADDGCPQARSEFVCIGVAPPVHVYPIDGDAHPSIASAVHTGVAVIIMVGGVVVGGTTVGPVALGAQQKSVDPLPSATPAPQVSEGSVSLGTWVPAHSKPMDDPVHPWMLVFCVQVWALGVKVAQQ